MNNLLIIEDDDGVRSYLQELLLDSGFSTYSASTGTEGIRAVEQQSPNLVILDLGLPDVSGESICLEVRKKYPHIKIIILSAKHNIADIINGLNLGADDYITKPFNADEFVARIHARLRENETGSTKVVVDDLEIDTSTYEAKRGGKLISLTPQEFKLLHYLLINRGRVLTRDMILSRIWVASPDIETRVVDVYMGYLRRKIDSGHKKKLLHSVRGFGYIVKA
jgi:two-component system, OmpR family, response regulator MprA